MEWRPRKIEFKIVEISEDIGWNEGWETIKFKKVKNSGKQWMKWKLRRIWSKKLNPSKRLNFFTIFQIPTYDNCIWHFKTGTTEYINLTYNPWRKVFSCEIYQFKMLASRVFFQFFEVGGLSVVFTQALTLVFGRMPKKYPSSQDATVWKFSILG